MQSNDNNNNKLISAIWIVRLHACTQMEFDLIFLVL